ncbi:MAG: hypothetical protein GC171_14820 [Terrimonas sp.]|nr:hypothetical protein [Terrimonas sp.]
MLTPDEKKFVIYWEKNRDQKKKVSKQLSVGLPAGTLIVIAIFINFFSGWYKRALMEYNADKSIFPVLLIAAAGIAVFFTVFSVRHKWDMNEQHYRELISKEKSGSSETAGDKV